MEIEVVEGRRRPGAEELPPILTVPEVARYLRIGKTTAYELTKHKDFPAVRVGRAVRVPRDSFLWWLEHRARAGTQL